MVRGAAGEGGIPEFGEYVTIIVVLCCAVSQSVKHNLLAAFRHLLRPLVRIALRNGFLFREFVGSVGMPT